MELTKKTIDEYTLVSGSGDVFRKAMHLQTVIKHPVFKHSTRMHILSTAVVFLTIHQHDVRL
jgi:hypothetical protein